MNGGARRRTSEQLGDLRSAYNAVIGQLEQHGRADDARACAELAVDQGVWQRPDQRPLELVDVPSQPIHDAAGFWFVPYLEERFAEIRDELDSVLASGHPAFLPVDEPLLGDGRWDQVVLYEAGARNDAACAVFPLLADVLAEIPEATTHGPGVVTLSWLHPGSRIIPHCGRSNAHLRVHFGLRIPPGPTMRVGPCTVGWEEGRCLVFDDSFEHEVEHPGSEPRIVLLLDVLHPQLPPETRARLLLGRRGIEHKIRAYMSSNEIGRVEVHDHGVTMEALGTRETMARRYLSAVGARSAELRDGRLRLDVV